MRSDPARTGPGPLSRQFLAFSSALRYGWSAYTMQVVLVSWRCIVIYDFAAVLAGQDMTLIRFSLRDFPICSDPA